MSASKSSRVRAVLGGAGNIGGWLRAAGIILIIAGLQASIFARHVAEAHNGVSYGLTELERERSNNSKMNAALGALRLYRRASGDEEAKHRILGARDTILERYPGDRQGAVEAMRNTAGTLEAQTPAERAALAEVRLRTEALADIYENRAGAALERYIDPPWYLQPTAAFLNDNPARLHALRFNHALYLMYSGDEAAAAAIFKDMRDADYRRTADVDYALARLAFDAWIAEPDPVLLAESLERTIASVRGNADNPLPKLFLEYLLSLDRNAEKVDLEPEEGHGDGEGSGERGVVSTDRGEF